MNVRAEYLIRCLRGAVDMYTVCRRDSNHKLNDFRRRAFRGLVPPHLLSGLDVADLKDDVTDRGLDYWKCEVGYSVSTASASEQLARILIECGVHRYFLFFDAFACIGGDTLRFMSNYRGGYANELHLERYRALCANVRIKRTAGGCRTVVVTNLDAVDAFGVTATSTREKWFAYLDPPWDWFKDVVKMRAFIAGIEATVHVHSTCTAFVFKLPPQRQRDMYPCLDDLISGLQRIFGGRVTRHCTRDIVRACSGTASMQVRVFCL